MSGGFVSEVEKVLGYSFRDQSLLRKALTHSSAEEADAAGNYETLEFLGDAVLELVTRKYLLGKHPFESEGSLTRRKIRFVRKDNLSSHGRRLGLHRLVRLGAGFDRTEGAMESLTADLVESIAGAMFLDSGLGPVEDFLEREILSRTVNSSALADARSRLQEYCQSRGLELPEFRLTDRSGPDHAPVFTVRVEIEGGTAGTGSGSSMSAAREAAAEALLLETGEDLEQ